MYLSMGKVIASVVASSTRVSEFLIHSSDHFGTDFGPFSDHFGVIFGPGGTPGTPFGPQGVPERILDRFGVHFGSPRTPFGTPFGSLFGSWAPPGDPKGRKRCPKMSAGGRKGSK